VDEADNGDNDDDDDVAAGRWRGRRRKPRVRGNRTSRTRLRETAIAIAAERSRTSRNTTHHLGNCTTAAIGGHLPRVSQASTISRDASAIDRRWRHRWPSGEARDRRGISDATSEAMTVELPSVDKERTIKNSELLLYYFLKYISLHFKNYCWYL